MTKVDYNNLTSKYLCHKELEKLESEINNLEEYSKESKEDWKLISKIIREFSDDELRADDRLLKIMIISNNHVSWRDQ